MKKQHIVIVGGGFAGVNLAREFGNKDGFEVTLVDQNNYHFFPPLIYQVGTAFIDSSNICYPFRKIFHHKKNLHFHYGTLKQIIPTQNQIITSSGSLYYDKLVLAMGTESNYFGMKDIEANAIPLKNIDDAQHLRNHLLSSMEKATLTNDPEEKIKFLTIVIAGGGPTGVELAGMIAYLAKHIGVKDFPELSGIRGDKPLIYLVDKAPALLSPMSKKSQEEALKTLERLGVRVILDVGVNGYEDGKVLFSDGSFLKTNNLIWTSGVIAREAPGLPEGSTGRGRRILVDEYNKVIGTDNIYAIGDICLLSGDPGFEGGHPQLAQVAIQQGQLLAKNLLNEAKGTTDWKMFRYNDKGSMAIITKYKAVVDLPKAFFKGFIAWIMWLFIHIIPIVSFGNKFRLAINWISSFITNDPNLRLIFRNQEKK